VWILANVFCTAGVSTSEVFDFQLDISGTGVSSTSFAAMDPATIASLEASIEASIVEMEAEAADLARPVPMAFYVSPPAPAAAP
jgi:hypothetical protein